MMPRTILKMNFNFNIKNMPGAAGASIHGVTNACDRHHMEKFGIKRAGRLVQWRFIDSNAATYAEFT